MKIVRTLIASPFSPVELRDLLATVPTARAVTVGNGVVRDFGPIADPERWWHQTDDYPQQFPTVSVSVFGESDDRRLFAAILRYLRTVRGPQAGLARVVLNAMRASRETGWICVDYPN